MKKTLILATSFTMLMVAAAHAFAFSYSTGFEASEGFDLGPVSGQNSWSQFAVNPGSAMVSNANPASGQQHLRLTQGPGASGTFSGPFSPNFGVQVSDIFTFSIDTFFSTTGGDEIAVRVQSPPQGLVAFSVTFASSGSIVILDKVDGVDTLVNTGRAFDVGVYRNLFVRMDNVAEQLEYFYDGDLIYTSGRNFATSFEQVVLRSRNNMGSDEFVDFDNLKMTGQPIPEPATMLGLAAGAALLAARRRRKG